MTFFSIATKVLNVYIKRKEKGWSEFYIEKRKGWKISNIKGDYQNGGIQWKEEGFKLLLLILVENSRLPMTGKNRKTKQMFNCTGEDTFILAPTMFYKL